MLQERWHRLSNAVRNIHYNFGIRLLVADAILLHHDAFATNYKFLSFLLLFNFW